MASLSLPVTCSLYYLHFVSSLIVRLCLLLPAEAPTGGWCDDSLMASDTGVTIPSINVCLL